METIGITPYQVLGIFSQRGIGHSYTEDELIIAMEKYASLKHSDYEKTYNSQCSRIDQLNERIAELEKENGESDIKILTLESRIEELTKELELLKKRLMPDSAYKR